MEIFWIEYDNTNVNLCSKWHVKLSGHPLSITPYSLDSAKIPDIILVHAPHFGMHRIKTLDALLRRHPESRAVMITAATDDRMRALLLRMGLGDLVPPDIGPAELVARMERLLPRDAPTHPILRHGPLLIDRQRRHALIGGQALPLMPREYALLLYLAEQAPRIIGRDELRLHLWGHYFDPGTNSVDVHICRLRRKLALAGHGTLVRTVRGCGYCIDAPPGIGGGESGTKAAMPCEKQAALS